MLSVCVQIWFSLIVEHLQNLFIKIFYRSLCLMYKWRYQPKSFSVIQYFSSGPFAQKLPLSPSPISPRIFNRKCKKSRDISNPQVIKMPRYRMVSPKQPIYLLAKGRSLQKRLLLHLKTKSFSKTDGWSKAHPGCIISSYF